MTLEEAKSYLHIDYSDEDTFIQTLLITSENYIDSMVGEGYKSEDKAVNLAKLLQYKLIADMYENRSTNIEDKSKQDRIVTSILDKLSLYAEVV